MPKEVTYCGCERELNSLDPTSLQTGHNYSQMRLQRQISLHPLWFGLARVTSRYTWIVLASHLLRSRETSGDSRRGIRTTIVWEGIQHAVECQDHNHGSKWDGWLHTAGIAKMPNATTANGMFSSWVSPVHLLPLLANELFSSWNNSRKSKIEITAVEITASWVAKTDYGLINQSTNHSTRSRRTCGCLRGILPRVLGAILLPGEVFHDSRGRLYTPGQLTRYPQEAKAHMRLAAQPVVAGFSDGSFDAERITCEEGGSCNQWPCGNEERDEPADFTVSDGSESLVHTSDEDRAIAKPSEVTIIFISHGNSIGVLGLMFAVPNILRGVQCIKGNNIEERS
ncbi:hypothetical protein PCH_Pc22g18640 [Penicillium rubens Wisconsin 54-1255]|uniref:Uncharacterized protein n=1 Tax=Penicillium rubens (strain ATCC 28089 / DSM 1075 / NRRL 1951 / Wisconsin 54-1255) TaxID=500485 RepID=B6HV11_PENRW|nr:hypothetical protein PCH_Pc22g18640 [Penicillium rubens Wisconsin 54-1255]